MPFVDLTVVAHGRDHVHHEIRAQAKALADIALGTQEARDVGIGRGGHLCNIRLRDAQLLGVHHAVNDPAHQVRPGVVALTDHGAERLLRDRLGQHDVRRGIGEGRAPRSKARLVVGIGVASAAEVGFDQNVDVLVGHRREGHAVRAEEVCQVQLGGGPGQHADRGPVQLQRRCDAAVGGHEEALTVVHVHGGEIEAQLRVAHGGPGRRPGQHVAFGVRQRGEPHGRGHGLVFHHVRVAEDRGRYGAAHVHVHARPRAVIGQRIETRGRQTDLAVQHAAFLHVRKRGLRECGRTCAQHQRAASDSDKSHISFPHWLFFHGTRAAGQISILGTPLV